MYDIKLDIKNLNIDCKVNITLWDIRHLLGFGSCRTSLKSDVTYNMDKFACLISVVRAAHTQFLCYDFSSTKHLEL